MPALKSEEGAILVKLARQSLAEALGAKAAPPPESRPSLEEPRGVFVTLHTYPKEELRGCIGFVRPDHRLIEAAALAARLAGLQDGRFAPVTLSELSSIIFEVSALTVPAQIKAADAAGRQKAVKIGQDGLIIQYGGASGLLLPQVALEWNFTPQEFLEAVCEKAGLPKDMWKSPSAKLWTFSAEIFAETRPNGPVAKKPLVR